MSEPDPARGSATAGRWRGRGHLTPEERRAVLEAVSVRLSRAALFRLAVMQVLSVVIATLGLITNSAAVVIGAMLIAPLMGPIVGISASMAMGWGRSAARNVGVVLVAAAVSIAIAALVSWLIPGTVVTSEMLARTAPATPDLLIALAAGLSGAYAIVRPEISSSLPGVAIAVALVPPLAAVGATWQAGQAGLATGALLLFATNLVAIVLAGLIVFPLSGFVPRARLRRDRRGLLIRAAAAAALVGVAALTLVARAAGPAREAARIADAQRAVSAWLTGTGLELDNVEVRDAVVVIDVAGPEPPPDTSTLSRQLVAVLGPSTEVEIHWLQRSTIRADPARVAELDLGRVRSAVDAWLAETGFDPASFDVDVERETDRIVVRVAGPTAPPPRRSLELRLLERFGDHIPVEVAASAAVVQSGLLDEATDAVSSWAAERDLILQSVEVDDTTDAVSVIVEGPSPPTESGSLRDVLTSRLGREIMLTVRYRPARLVPLEPAVTTDV